MRKLARRHPWQTSVVFLGVLAVAAKSTLQDAGNIAAIVAAVASVAILAAGTVRWLRRRWSLWRPLDVFYIGADSKPCKTWAASRGGDQHLLLNIQSRLDVRIEDIWFGFRGSDYNMPKDEGFSAIASDFFRAQSSRITRGRSDPSDLMRYPSFLPKRARLAYPRHIVTRGPWEGEIELRFTLLTADRVTPKRYVKHLPFRVGGDVEKSSR